MASNRLSHATWRTVAPIAILTVSLVALLAWSAFMVRNAMLRNAEMLGTQLARTYAAEEEAHINAFSYAVDIARHHHERWDGHGYPDGLAGDDISIWAQAVSIADVYDALMSKRVYKDAIPRKRALEMIRSGACGVFGPKLLAAFERVEPELAPMYGAANDQEVDHER